MNSLKDSPGKFLMDCFSNYSQDSSRNTLRNFSRNSRKYQSMHSIMSLPFNSFRISISYSQRYIFPQTFLQNLFEEICVSKNVLRHSFGNSFTNFPMNYFQNSIRNFYSSKKLLLENFSENLPGYSSNSLPEIFQGLFQKFLNGFIQKFVQRFLQELSGEILSDFFQ